MGEPQISVRAKSQASRNVLNMNSINGIYHSVSEAHLHRYLKEFDFRYNNRVKLGVEDAERAAKVLKGVEGKRLTYNQAAI